MSRLPAPVLDYSKHADRRGYLPRGWRWCAYLLAAVPWAAVLSVHLVYAVEWVLDREATRTTGIGNGLAIPHGKCNGTDHLVMAIGRPATPIDFQAIVGRPVSLIWLLTSPPDKTGPHIHALARISRLMTIDRFRQALANAKTAQEIYDAIVQQENAL